MRGSSTCFNPLFIGACHRTGRRDVGGAMNAGEVSIPSSSGHVIGLGPRMWSSRSAGRVSIPSSSGHVFGRMVDAVEHGQRAAVSIPSSSGHVIGLLDGALPSHSDGMVSIPSSSGHVFGSPKSTRYWVHRSRPSFNPLFIGACHRTGVAWQVTIADEVNVSIPSSSGHVVRTVATAEDRGSAYRGFNPLFIGACRRTHATGWSQ